MNLETLEHFLYLAECKSISEAAQKSYLSRQALTDAMNKLERELGVFLFNRSKQGVSLTEEGKYLYHFLDDLRGPWSTMLADIRNLNKVDRVIKIGLPQFIFSDAILLKIMHLSDDIAGCSILVQDYPTEVCWDYLRNGTLDTAVTHVDPFDSQLVFSSAVASLHNAFLCASIYSEFAQKDSICKNDLASRTIVSVEASTMAADKLKDYCKEAKARLRIVPRSHTLIEDIVSHGDSFFIAPAAASFFFDSEHIIGIPITDFPKVFNQHIVHSKSADEDTIKIAKKLKSLLEESIR